MARFELKLYILSKILKLQKKCHSFNARVKYATPPTPPPYPHKNTAKKKTKPKQNKTKQNKTNKTSNVDGCKRKRMTCWVCEKIDSH